MHSVLFKFTLVLNSVLLLWKLLVFEFQLGISETLLCSVSASHVKIVPLLDVYQLLMFFLWTLRIRKQERSPIIHDVIIVLTIIVLTCMYVCM
jgi:hypothetical protein